MRAREAKLTCLKNRWAFGSRGFNRQPFLFPGRVVRQGAQRIARMKTVGSTSVILVAPGHVGVVLVLASIFDGAVPPVSGHGAVSLPVLIGPRAVWVAVVEIDGLQPVHSAISTIQAKALRPEGCASSQYGFSQSEKPSSACDVLTGYASVACL
jgi:hypothetical protein